jgi:riboflavin kinase / FMN adenylyltransferase
MKVFTSLPTSPLLTPHAITIGVFDGVHLGHQAILRETTKYHTSCVLTFRNHPASFFNPNHQIPFIITLEERLELFEKEGIEVVFLLPFDQAFADLSYDSFLYYLKETLQLSHLILGEGESFGKGKKGDAEQVLLLSKKWGFAAVYLPKILLDGNVISSSRIRTLIQQGNNLEAERLLGRPYLSTNASGILC